MKLDFKYLQKLDAISKATKLIEICKLQDLESKELTRITARIDNIKRGYIKGELTKKEKRVYNAISQYDLSIRQARDWFKTLCLRPKLQEKIKQNKLSIKQAIKLNNEILFKSRLTQEKILEEIREAFEELGDINEA